MDIQNLYKGSLLGGIWLIIFPLLMLLLFTFVFGTIFQARWGSDQTIENFIMMLFTGLILYQAFSDSLTKSSDIIRSKKHFVQKVKLPLEIFPLINVLTSFFCLLLSTIILIFFIYFFKGGLNWSAILYPLIILPFFISTVAFSVFISAIGVFLKDIKQIITFSMSALFFLSPIIYPITSLPLKIQKLIYLNPLSLPIEISRLVLIEGKTPNFLTFLIYFLISIILFYFSYSFFKKSEEYFADYV